MCFVDKSLEIRAAARRFFLGWFKPSILAEEKFRTELNKTLQKHWSDSPIEVYELIHENWDDEESAPTTDASPEDRYFIVFIDPQLDIDWISKKELSPDSNKCISYAESVGARRCQHLPKEQVLEFKRLVGQAIVNGLLESTDQSCKLADSAAQFLKDRTTERSRYWTLVAAHGLFFGGILIAAICFLTLQPLWILTPVGFWLAAAGGFLGAYLSVIQKAGDGTWDAASGKGIHILEVLTKLVAGTLFGAIAFILTRSVHVPQSIKDITPDGYSLFLFGFAAGLFERLIPKLVSNYSAIKEGD